MAMKRAAVLAVCVLALVAASDALSLSDGPSFVETRLRRSTAEPRCGKEFGNKKCSDIGKSGQCCSKFGYCGSKAFHCVTRFGCQSECDNKKDPGSEESSSMSEAVAVRVGSSSSGSSSASESSSGGDAAAASSDGGAPQKVVRIKEVMNAVPLCKKCMGAGSAAAGSDSIAVPLMKLDVQASQSSSGVPDVVPPTTRPVSGLSAAGSVVAAAQGALGSQSLIAPPVSAVGSMTSVVGSLGSVNGAPVPTPASVQLSSMMPQASGSLSLASQSAAGGGDPLLQSDVDMIKQITADATKRALQIVAEAERAAVRVRQSGDDSSSKRGRRRVAVMIPDSKASKTTHLVPNDVDRFEMGERALKQYGHE